jgi:hypothetical protein
VKYLFKIIGCAASIMFISPQMTVVMMLVMPSIVVVGTVFGSVLRKFSREAQIQVQLYSYFTNQYLKELLMILDCPVNLCV